jgi:hypothetical protein
MYVLIKLLLVTIFETVQWIAVPIARLPNRVTPTTDNIESNIYPVNI